MSEFKSKNKKELLKTLSEKRGDLQKFRFESSGGRSKDVKQGYNLRKDIARVMTELNAQAAAEAKEKLNGAKDIPVKESAKPAKKAVKTAKAVVKAKKS